MSYMQCLGNTNPVYKYTQLASFLYINQVTALEIKFVSMIIDFSALFAKRNHSNGTHKTKAANKFCNELLVNISPQPPSANLSISVSDDGFLNLL